MWREWNKWSLVCIYLNSSVIWGWNLLKYKPSSKNHVFKNLFPTEDFLKNKTIRNNKFKCLCGDAIARRLLMIKVKVFFFFKKPFCFSVKHKCGFCTNCHYPIKYKYDSILCICEMVIDQLILNLRHKRKQKSRFYKTL